MAKAKATSNDDVVSLVETVQDNNFRDPEPPPAPRGERLEEQISAIRDQRARERAVRGKAAKRRHVTSYHDAERLLNLATGKVAGGHRDSFGRPIRGSKNHFPELAEAREIVDWEEQELLPNPEHYATGSAMGPVDDVPPAPLAEGEDA